MPDPQQHLSSASPQEPTTSLTRLRRRLERERKLREQLEALLEDKTRELYLALESVRDQQLALTRLSAGVAHEINNALNFIKGNAQHLSRYMAVFQEVIEAYRAAVADDEKKAQELAQIERDKGLDFVEEDLPKLLAAIHTGVNRASEIVRDLGAYSKPSGAEMQLASVLRPVEMALTLSTNALKRKVTVHKDFETDDPIYCHVGQLSQVFLNLFINAAHAIENKGDLFVSTRRDGDWVVVSVRDTGAGMSEEVRRRIFDPFFTTKAPGEGTGLGLVVTKRIVEEHGGTIECESRLGEGTTFFVRLPLARNTSEKEREGV